jgi:hypothetical protein
MVEVAEVVPMPLLPAEVPVQVGQDSQIKLLPSEEQGELELKSHSQPQAFTMVEVVVVAEPIMVLEEQAG